MGNYASRGGPPDSPNVPDPFIFPEEERVIDLMDDIEQRGDLARDAITLLVRQLCIRIAEQNNELEHRPTHETGDDAALARNCLSNLLALVLKMPVRTPDWAYNTPDLRLAISEAKQLLGHPFTEHALKAGEQP